MTRMGLRTVFVEIVVNNNNNNTDEDDNDDDDDDDNGKDDHILLLTIIQSDFSQYETFPFIVSTCQFAVSLLGCHLRTILGRFSTPLEILLPTLLLFFFFFHYAFVLSLIVNERISQEIFIIVCSMDLK